MKRYVFPLILMLVSSICVAQDNRIKVGSPAPDFVATGIDGKAFRLSEKLADGDKNIILLFSRAHW